MFRYERNARFERAEKKAREVRPNVMVNGYGDYFVEGSEQIYAVTIAAEGGLMIDCNCLAGQNEKPCYHAAAAYARHLTLPAGQDVRDRDLQLVEQDLRFIARRANDMSGDYDLMDDICRAVRSALKSLGDFEAARAQSYGHRAA